MRVTIEKNLTQLLVKNILGISNLKQQKEYSNRQWGMAIVSSVT